MENTGQYTHDYREALAKFAQERLAYVGADMVLPDGDLIATNKDDGYVLFTTLGTNVTGAIEVDVRSAMKLYYISEAILAGYAAQARERREKNSREQRALMEPDTTDYAELARQRDAEKDAG